MTTLVDTSKINLDSLIPTGPWTLYFHSSEETKWTLNTFVSLGSMSKWRDFWTIIDTLKDESLSEGMFFMMRDPCPPLWESHHNIRGGCYSFRCNKKEAADTYINYIIASMLGNISTNADNNINGLSISPKRGFNILKIWNIDAHKYNTPSDLNNLTLLSDSDMLYTPFIQKKM